jgi:hypothetical protein
VAHPRRQNSRPQTLEKVRDLCLGLPETSEKEAWGGPTFRVKGKMFAMYLDDHHGDGRVALWCKSTHEARDAVIASDPDRFFVPPYVGTNGWLGVRLDKRLGWKRITELVEHGWRLAAPKRVAALLAKHQGE